MRPAPHQRPADRRAELLPRVWRFALVERASRTQLRLRKNADTFPLRALVPDE